MTINLIPAASQINLSTVAVTGQRVYVGYDGAAHLKLGTSISTTRRGGELKLTMILSVPGDELSERRIQRMFRACHAGQEWYWPTAPMIAWLHALIDSGEARIECGTAAEAHKLVSLIYQRRWDIPSDAAA